MLIARRLVLQMRHSSAAHTAPASLICPHIAGHRVPTCPTASIKPPPKNCFLSLLSYFEDKSIVELGVGMRRTRGIPGEARLPAPAVPLPAFWLTGWTLENMTDLGKKGFGGSRRASL